MTPFQLQTNKKLLFGIGARNRLVSLLKEFPDGPIAFISGKTVGASPQGEELLSGLGKERKISHHFISGEPSPATVDSIAEQCRKEKTALVIALGGGSVIDGAKGVSAMVCEEGGITDFLEGVGTKSPSGKKIPLIAMPTTSGTGTEATKNAVITDRDKGYKKSLRHDNYIPDIALIDPEFTLSCPASVTKACGLDAFSQLMESYFSTNASVYTDMLAFEGMVRISRSFMGVCTDKANDLDARSDMAYGAYLSGITLANAGLGTVHGISGAMGGLFNIPHGTACGLLLKPVMEVTFKKLAIIWQAEKWESKLKRVSMMLSGKSVKKYDAALDILINSLDTWLKELDLKSLKHYGIREEDFGKIVIASGNKNNPYELTAEEMEQVLISVQ